MHFKSLLIRSFNTSPSITYLNNVNNTRHVKWAQIHVVSGKLAFSLTPAYIVMHY